MSEIANSSKLEKFGIIPGDASVLQHTQMNILSEEAFFDRATLKLKGIEGIVREDMLPGLSKLYGRWHPSGFMVYPLGYHPELGGLRLHIWPKGFRQREIKGLGEMSADKIYDGDIHNHAWHIASLVLGGVYEDTMYKVQPSIELEPHSLTDEEVVTAGLHHVFQVSYRTSTHPEALRTTGDYVTASPIKSRSVLEGSMHYIMAGPFHAPVLDEDQFAATLVFNSPRVHGKGPDILIAGSSRPIIGNRIDVSHEEAVEASAQLNK